MIKKAKSETMRIDYAVSSCSLGQVLVAKTSRGLCAIFIGLNDAELKQDLQRRFSTAAIQAGDGDIHTTLNQVIGMLDHARPIPSGLSVDLIGTVFQRRVWKALRKIPSGQTLSYSELAKQIGQPKAHRAVASACGANPLALIVPCHRIIRSDGSLGGYRWGVKIKRRLLERELD